MWWRRTKKDSGPVGTLTIVPFYSGSSQALIEPLIHKIASTFHLQISHQSPEFDPEEAYDASRGQYDTRALLSRLLAQPLHTDRVLGVTDVDLFVPVLTFVFGEAQVGGRAAIVSSHRLDPERYGLPADLALLEQRLYKETIHELGHSLGLIHCGESRCVMASSPAVEGIDLKTDRFCGSCGRSLGAAVQRGAVI